MKNDARLFATLPDILSTQEVQVVLGIGRKGVYNLLENRAIRCFKIGHAYKIPKRALIEFIEEQCRDKKGGSQV